MRQLRVRAFTNEDYSGYQLLQEKRRFFGWRTIDREDVPESAKISGGATGFYGWESRFTKYGTFGRDGIVVPHAVSEEAPAAVPQAV